MTARVGLEGHGGVMHLQGRARGRGLAGLSKGLVKRVVNGSSAIDHSIYTPLLARVYSHPHPRPQSLKSEPLPPFSTIHHLFIYPG